MEQSKGTSALFNSDLNTSQLYLRPFVIAQIDPVIREELISKQIDESTRRLKQIANHMGVPNIQQLNLRGFEGLKELSIVPPPSLQKATSNFLSKVADSLMGSLYDQFMEICCVDNRFITDFTFSDFSFSPTDYDNQLNERDFKVFAYAVYQDPANAQAWFKTKSSTAPSIVRKVSEEMHNYAIRFEQLIRFFLYEPWFNNKSLIDILTTYWGDGFNFKDINLEILPLGFPDAYYKASWDDKIEKLFQPINDQGNDILTGISVELAKELTTCLYAGVNVEIYSEQNNYQVISWNLLKEIGFFRSTHSVQVDPGLPILEIVEVLVHELTHHVYHCLTDTGFFTYDNSFCYMSSPCLNEGFVEYHTELCLKEMFKTYPELEYYQLARRIFLHSEDYSDIHVSGVAFMNYINNSKARLNDIKTDFIIENLQVTPAFKLSIEPKKTGNEQKITYVEIPTPEFMEDTLHQCTEVFQSRLKHTFDTEGNLRPLKKFS